MEMRHTPGPWGVGIETLRYSDDHGQVISSEGEHLATVSMFPILENTRLIAAAPELLEGCRDALDYADSDESSRSRAFRRRLEIVIAKVEGKTP